MQKIFKLAKDFESPKNKLFDAIHIPFKLSHGHKLNCIMRFKARKSNIMNFIEGFILFLRLWLTALAI